LHVQAQEISEIKDDIAAIKTDLAVLTTEVKTFKENVNKRFDGIEKRFDGIEKRFDGIENNFNRLNNIIIACIGIPLAILTIGAILAHRRGVRDSTQQKEIESLKAEIETLKQRHIVSP
jgi:chaperonin cofactor prefoldin